MGEINRDFRVDILFPNEFQDMIAEIYFRNEFLCLISQDEGYDSIDVEIVNKSKDANWKFKLADFEEAIVYAKKRLWELRKTAE